MLEPTVMGMQLKTCHYDGGPSFNRMKAIGLVPPEPTNGYKNSQSNQVCYCLFQFMQKDLFEYDHPVFNPTKKV